MREPANNPVACRPYQDLVGESKRLIAAGERERYAANMNDVPVLNCT